MTDHDREARVLDAVVTLVDSLLQDFDLVELLTDLTERCVQLIDVSSAGLLLADARGQLHLMAATSERTEDIELFQLQADVGPCLDCYTSGQAVSVADLAAAAQEWPDFVAAARAAGFASLHALPMRAAGGALGALGLFGTRAGSLDDADLLVGRSLAHVASVAIVQEHPPTADTLLPRLQGALASRVVVEQAKGLLRQQLGLSVADAFTLLRGFARSTGAHLSQLARRLMFEPEARPALIAALRNYAADTRAPGSAT